MLNDKSISLKEERAYVSELIFSVLCEKQCVRDALLKFPQSTEDKSVIAAWHALSHYEADEDLRKKDINYRKEQDNFLEFIAFYLKDNKDLPVNIINNYNSYYKDIPIADNITLKGNIRKLFRFLNIF